MRRPDSRLYSWRSLFAQLQDQGISAHILGDACARRRLVWSTRQACDLAATR